jgi:CRP-like cAMP-binding protein
MVVRCEFLKKCSFLDPLSNEQISKLAGALESSSYADGEYVIRQGDTGESFFIIEEGNVKCTQIKASGREVDLLLVVSSLCDALLTVEIILIIILCRFLEL